jgi:hypothetical protein
MTSYQKIITFLETFCDNHYQVQKFGADFVEQLPNFATEDEKYPIIFVSPTGETPQDVTKLTSLEIRCLDIIQKDRQNITTIISDTGLILDDIYLELNTGDDWTYDVVSVDKSPLNNDILDYCAGWVMNITLESQIHCENEIPQP